MQRYQYIHRMVLVVLWVVTVGLSAGVYVVVPRDHHSLPDVLARGTLDAVKALLATPAGRAQVNQKTAGGDSPLLIREWLPSSLLPFEKVKVLLESGADPTIASRGGRTPLHNAALVGCQRSFKILMAYGAHINAVTVRTQYSPLHVAVVAHRQDPKLYREYMIWLLIDYGADVDVEDAVEGRSPLQMASDALRPVLEQRVSEHLRAIRVWAEKLQHDCGLSADVVRSFAL